MIELVFVLKINTYLLSLYQDYIFKLNTDISFILKKNLIYKFVIGVIGFTKVTGVTEATGSVGFPKQKSPNEVCIQNCLRPGSGIVELLMLPISAASTFKLFFKFYIKSENE